MTAVPACVPATEPVAFRVTETHYRVISPGEPNAHVHFDDLKIVCTCLKWHQQQRCSHTLIAIRQYQSDLRSFEHMKITGRPVESNEQRVRQQPIRIAQGLYGGLLASYSKPKIYKNIKSGEDEEKFYVRFLVTHTAALKQLPKFTEAFCGVRTKLFYDEQKGTASTMVRLFGALCAKTLTMREIADGADLPDLDDLICWPAMLMIKPYNGPDADGIVSNMIDTQAVGFMPPDPEYRKLALPIYKKADMTYGENGSALRYLKSPSAEFETTSAAATDPGAADGGAPEEDEPWG